MDDAGPSAPIRSIRALAVADAEIVAPSSSRFDSEDVRLFACSFVAGFLFFLIWLS